MRVVMRNAMEDGAFGLASALIYPPGNFASTEELIEVARAMAPYGGVYITHMRSEADQFLEAIDEAIRIGKEGGVPVEIYHLKAAGRRNWPKAAQAIAKIDSARARRARRAGEHVLVRRGRHRTVRVPAALGLGGRKAPRQPEGSGDARAHPRRDGAGAAPSGRTSASSPAPRACSSSVCARTRTSASSASAWARSRRRWARSGRTPSWICSSRRSSASGPCTS